jgi:hypothetical protein
MSVLRDGQSAINFVNNSTAYNNQLADFNQQIQSGIIKAARVKGIILDSTSKAEGYDKLGEDNSIGTIIYDDNIELPNTTTDLSKFPIARPLFSNIKNYPLINELVYILTLPSSEIGKNTDAKTNYYLNTIALWNHPHHNAYPDTPFNLAENQKNDYVTGSFITGSGKDVYRRVTDNYTGIKLGNTFKERSNIHPLLSFEGDVIYEGRWGNSIRFGSTVKNRSNNWSTTGTDGDPILILRNGQLVDATTEGWVPIVEDINKDISSLYLTSTQKIPIRVSSNNYKSYSSFTPTAPDQFSDKQIILNSGRLLFNSNKDHILLSSALTIGFNAIKGFNFDTNANFVVNSPSIQLGGKDAVEPLLLGKTTIDLLSELVTQLSNLCIALQTVPTPSGPAVAPAATQLITYLSTLKTALETTTQSKISKTL